MAEINRKPKWGLSNKVLFVCTLLATLSLVIGCLITSSWLWAALVIAGGVFWLFGQKKGWGWVANLELLFFVFTAALCVRSGVSAGFMLFVLASALCTWDLDGFHQRLKKAGHVEERDALEKNHLKRLITVIVVGSIFSLPVLVFDLHLKFGWILLLGTILLLGLIWLLRQATREG